MNRRRDGWVSLLVLITAIAIGASGGSRTRRRPEHSAGARAVARLGARPPPGTEVSAALRQRPGPPLRVDEHAEPRSRPHRRSLHVDVEVFSEADVTLPGGPDQWPTRRALELGARHRDAARRPTARTPRTGPLQPERQRSSWSEMPDAISLPRQHGILRLTLDGARRRATADRRRTAVARQSARRRDRSAQRFADGARVPAHRRRRADDADHLRRSVGGRQPSDRHARACDAGWLRNDRDQEQPAGAPRR